MVKIIMEISREDLLAKCFNFKDFENKICDKLDYLIDALKEYNISISNKFFSDPGVFVISYERQARSIVIYTNIPINNKYDDDKINRLAKCCIRIKPHTMHYDCTPSIVQEALDAMEENAVYLPVKTKPEIELYVPENVSWFKSEVDELFVNITYRIKINTGTIRFDTDEPDWVITEDYMKDLAKKFVDGTL